MGRRNFGKDQTLCRRIEWLPDITSAVPQDARKLCAAGLVDDESALDSLNTLEARAQSIIRRTLAAIEPEDVERMLPHQK